MTKGRLLIAVLIAAVVGAFFLLGLDRYLSFDYVKSSQDALYGYVHAHPWRSAAMYFLIYVTVAALSIPGAALMTLIGGAVFGLLWGTVIVSFASSIGATVAFLVARYLLRDWVQDRFRERMRPVNEGVRRDGAFYLFTLRLIAYIPFFVINLVMGLTPMRTATFYAVSQVAMLPATVVYVNAGTRLAALDSPADVLSPALIVSFALIGLFPLLARRAAAWLKARRALRGFVRPRSFDRNLVVIGAGSAGLVSAYLAAAMKARVTLIERGRMGGDCLNTGCVPSKALIRSARFIAQARRAREYGMKSAEVEFDFAEVMERVQKVVAQVEPHDSVERYTALGVECISGQARLASPWEVEVGGRRLTTRAIVLATGGAPFVPPIPGIEEAGYLTSDSVWSLRELPERLVVLGGGPIGCELAQCFARLGSRVTIVQQAPRLLVREDHDVSERLLAALRAEGVDVRLGHRALACEKHDGGKELVCEHDGERVRFDYDALLVAVGRRPVTDGLGLETLGISTDARGNIEHNEYLQTAIPNVLVCGDVAGPYQFTHTAAHQAWFATVNALFGQLWRFKADYSVIPWCTFTEPEIATVGLNELAAKEKGVAYELTQYDIADLDRAIADGEAGGVVRVLTAPGSDRILGATIVGEHAGELIAEFVAAMRHGLGLGKILGTIHVYPTLTEANKHAAGAWRRAHTPERLMPWLARYHAWRRAVRTNGAGA